jgi:hypothetical protein
MIYILALIPIFIFFIGHSLYVFFNNKEHDLYPSYSIVQISISLIGLCGCFSVAHEINFDLKNYKEYKEIYQNYCYTQLDSDKMTRIVCEIPKKR